MDTLVRWTLGWDNTAGDNPEDDLIVEELILNDVLEPEEYMLIWKVALDDCPVLDSDGRRGDRAKGVPDVDIVGNELIVKDWPPGNGIGKGTGRIAEGEPGVESITDPPDVFVDEGE